MTGRPSQKTQKSRKGKKEWRKNIDLDEIEQNIDEQSTNEIVLGLNEPLFEVDRTGSAELTSEMKKERKLKSLEILHQRSAFPAVVNNHRKKDKKKTKISKDVKGILERAGFTEKSTSSAQLERDGLLKAENTLDLWGEPKKEPVFKAPTATPNPTRKPLKPQPIVPGTVAVEVPKGGLSYNPALEDWKQSVLLAHNKIKLEEDQKQKAIEEQAKIDAIIAETEAKLENPSSSESESESEEETDFRLSVNPPAAVKRKTRTERNKQRRHKQFLYELNLLRQKKKFLADLSKEKEPPLVKSKPKQEKLKRKAHSAYPLMEEPLAIKLSDELDDSLRRLKPEGSLLKERMRSFQARGFVEARVPVKKRKARFKMVEKYSYRD